MSCTHLRSRRGTEPHNRPDPLAVGLGACGRWMRSSRPSRAVRPYSRRPWPVRPRQGRSCIVRIGRSRPHAPVRWCHDDLGAPRGGHPRPGGALHPCRRPRLVRGASPEIHQPSVSAHLQSVTSNAPDESKHAGLRGRRPVVTRIDRGQYVRFGEEVDRPALTAATGSHRPLGRPVASALSCDAPSIALVGCGRTKRGVPAPASDLYTSRGFRLRAAYAEQESDHWFVLSAEYGLVRPDEWISPYDLNLAAASSSYRRAWGEMGSRPAGSTVRFAGGRHDPGRRAGRLCLSHPEPPPAVGRSGGSTVARPEAGRAARLAREPGRRP